MTPTERFLAKVSKTDGCWLWTGAVNNQGYGRFECEGFNYAHRFSYSTFVGPIPDGLVLDHLCRTPLCVRPDHLEPVTQRENTRRGDRRAMGEPRRAQTHCPHGHPWDEANTLISRTARGGFQRQCRACMRIRAERRRRLVAEPWNLLREWS